MNALQQIAYPVKEAAPKGGQLAMHHASSVDHVLMLMHEFAAELSPDNCYLDTLRLNDQPGLHEFILEISSNLKLGEYYIGRVDHVSGYESDEDPERYIAMGRFHRTARYIWHRVFPKLSLTKSIHKRLNRQGRRLSRTETLGRLKFMGFEIRETRMLKKEMVFVVQKDREPIDTTEPHYGPLIRLNRLGKNGRIKGIYKFRTMYPYAEYIQDYVYEQNSLAKGGKLHNDFRISAEGRIMRRLFIDEFPMLINLVKGDIKLVGVRPLTKHYFSLYTNNMQNKRIKHKPGLLPPFYAEKSKPETLEDVMVSEIRYLFLHERNPLKTDLKYFFRIMNNIITRKARSN